MRRTHWQVRPVRVMTESVGDLPVLTLQDPADVQGAVVRDCRPPLLPVSIPLSALGPMTGQHSRGTTSMCVPPHDEEYSVLNMDTDVITFRELGVAPLNDSGTGIKDELPTPTDSPVPGEVCSIVTAEPQVLPVQEDGFDLELAKIMLEVSVMPMMITLINDPMVSPVVSPAEYTVPPIPTKSTDERVPLLSFPPVQEIVDSPVRECSPLPLASSGGVNIRPASPLLLSSGRLADAPDPPPRRMATMDQYLPREQPV